MNSAWAHTCRISNFGGRVSVHAHALLFPSPFQLFLFVSLGSQHCYQAGRMDCVKDLTLDSDEVSCDQLKQFCL